MKICPLDPAIKKIYRLATYLLVIVDVVVFKEMRLAVFGIQNFFIQTLSIVFKLIFDLNNENQLYSNRKLIIIDY